MATKVKWVARQFVGYVHGIELDVQRSWRVEGPWMWQATPQTISGPALFDQLSGFAKSSAIAMRRAEMAARRLKSTRSRRRT